MQKEIADNLQRLEALEQKYTKTKENANKIQAKIQTELSKEDRLNKQIYQQKERTLNQEARLQAQLTKSENIYTKVQAKINILTKTYNNLATKKELGLKLTIREEAQLNSLTSRLEKYNGVLKKVDADIGKNQRNVGNYASSWNGLGNSINQLTREAPAFAVSMSTGFLALSNNIPILADEIQNLINKNKDLQAQGKPTKSVLGSILGAVLSWQTALSVGVTLLTLYGDKVVDWVRNLGNANYSVKALESSTKAYNEALKSGEYKKAYEDITKVGVAFEQAKKGTISKKEALAVYNETLGDTFGKTNSLNEAQSIYTSKSGNFIEATLLMATANNILAETADIVAERIRLSGDEAFSFYEKVKAYFNVWSEKINDSGSNSISNIIKHMFASANATDIATQALDNRSKAIAKARKQEEENLKVISNVLDEYNKKASGLNMSVRIVTGKQIGRAHV